MGLLGTRFSGKQDQQLDVHVSQSVVTHDNGFCTAFVHATLG